MAQTEELTEELSEVAETAAYQDAKPNEPLPCFCEIPESSPVYRLWEIWRDSMPKPEQTPQLKLRLDLALDERALPMMWDEMEKETRHICTALQYRASARLKKRAPDGTSLPQEIACWTYISRTGMVAWAMCVPEIGPAGEPPSEQELMQTLAQAGIVYGIDREAVRRLQKARFELLPVAFGMRPVEGTNGSIVERFARECKNEICMDEHGNVDYRTRSYVQNICKGDIICDIIPPVEGTEGMQVNGKAANPRPVSAGKVPAGTNTHISEDGLHLIAAMDGHLEFVGHTFQVKTYLNISGDVDYSTGNVNYRGDVQISGDVRENFSVRATGKVVINGLVEAGTVEADGDIVISHGVLGDNKARLRSRNVIRVKYMENCEVYAGKNMYMECSLLSKLYCDGTVSVKSGRGTIIGGCVTAGERIEANIIGTQSGRKTEITLGVKSYSQKEYQENAETLASLEEQTLQAEKQLQRFKEHPESNLVAKLRIRQSVLALNRDRILKRQAEIEAIQTDLNYCRLECDMLYPPVYLTIGDASVVIEDKWENLIACYCAENHTIKLYSR